MSDLPPNDPFGADDPAAAERERRRREREARRAGRSEGARRSLADRVTGALGGAAERGREAIDGIRDAGSEDPGREGGDRLGSQAAGPVPDDPLPAEYDPEPDAQYDPDHDPEPEAQYDPDHDPEPEAQYDPDHDPFSATDEFEAAGPAGGYAQVDTGEDEPVPPRRDVPARPRSAHAGHDIYWRRRIAAAGAAIGAVVLLVAVVAVAGRGGGDGEETVAEPEPLETIDVTVPEGLTIEQMADVADDARLRGNYVRAARRAMNDFNLRRYGAEDAPDLEGFLFPATYELERRAPVEDLVERQLDAFEQNIGQVDMRKAERRNLTVYDVVKIASMIEREVSIDEERRLASAVMHNRLGDGEPLGIDATLRYELDKHDGQLLESELQADTPYNTRTRAGLPPTPIANPGLASLEAAADPANRDFRWYVIKPGTCNEHLFTADAAEFEAARAEYQAALEAEGGSPTEC